MKKGIVLSFIIILASVALIIGAFFVLNNKPKSTNQITTQTASPSPVNESVYTEAVDTSNWKTYTNTDLGFSVKHPSDYKIDETSGSVVLYKGEKLKTPPNSPIDPYPIETSISILDRGSSCGDCTAFKLQETKIASYRAQKVLDITHFNDIYVYNNTNTRVFRVGYGSDSELYQILSTFKFTD